MHSALVSGATGLVGSHVVERLLARGWRVRALVRQADAPPGSMAAWLRDQGVELARGDVLDAESFRRAALGTDVVFHTAAAITPRGGWEAYRLPNVEGTRNAIAAAEAASARLLHLSSVAVYGPKARYHSPSGRTDEATPLQPLPETAHYARSKRESEQMVLEAHGAGRVWATAVRPSVIYGPRDRQFIPRVARLLRFGVAPVVGEGASTLSIVHAANVAEGAVLAALHDAAGGRAFNLANDFDVRVAEFFRLAGEGLGRRVRILRIPLGAAKAGLTVFKAGTALLTGGSLSVVRNASLDLLTKDNPFSSELARRELGWVPPVAPAEGVPGAFAWWRAARRR